MNERNRTVRLHVRLITGMARGYEGALTLIVWSATDGEAMALAARALPVCFEIRDMRVAHDEVTP